MKRITITPTIGKPYTFPGYKLGSTSTAKERIVTNWHLYQGRIGLLALKRDYVLKGQDSPFFTSFLKAYSTDRLFALTGYSETLLDLLRSCGLDIKKGTLGYKPDEDKL